jgi:hypothetical protein
LLKVLSSFARSELSRWKVCIEPTGSGVLGTVRETLELLNTLRRGSSASVHRVDVGVTLVNLKNSGIYKNCVRSALGKHLYKYCKNPSEGLAKHQECARGKAIFPYKLR